MKVTDAHPNVGRPVAYYPGLRQLCGSINAAILYCQVLYWTGKQSDPRGWIHKRACLCQDDPEGVQNPENQSIEFETGMTYKEQLVARHELRDRGFLEERYSRSEHRLYFRLNLAAIRKAWGGEPAEGKPREMQASAQRDGGTFQNADGISQNADATCQNADSICPKGKSLIGTYIDYTETTSESSSRETSAAAATGDVESGSACEEHVTELPSTPAEAMRHPAILLFQQVCGRIPGEKQYRSVIETMNHFRQKKGEAVVDYLRPFWLAWSGRKRRRDGQPYDPASLTWLTEWALNEAIPPEMGGNDGALDSSRGGDCREERDRPFTAEQLATLKRFNDQGRQPGLPDL